MGIDRCCGPAAGPGLGAMAADPLTLEDTNALASRQRRARRTVCTHQRNQGFALRSRIHPEMDKAKHTGRLTRQRKREETPST